MKFLRFLLCAIVSAALLSAAEPVYLWRHIAKPDAIGSLGLLTPAANRIPYYTGANTAGLITVGGNLSLTGGTLNLSSTPNIGAATGTSLVLTGNMTASGGVVVGGSSITLQTTGGDTNNIGGWRFWNGNVTTAGRYISVAVGKDGTSGASAEVGVKIDTATPANARTYLVNYGDNQDTQSLVVAKGGNVTVGQNLTVSSTQASTSSSSGALVVGNGSAGGLGVGGNITTGNNIVTGGDITVNGGNIGLAAAADSAIGIRLNTSLSGSAFQYGIYNFPTYSSAATSSVDGMVMSLQFGAGASPYTVPGAQGIRIIAPTLGANATVTTLTGIKIANQGAAGVANVIGLDIDAQSGAATANIGIRNNGSTFLLGNVTVGSTGTSISKIRHGTATLVAGTVTVADSSIAAGSRVFVGQLTPGGTVGSPYVSAKSNGASFTITSTSGSDTSVVSYLVIDP